MHYKCYYLSNDALHKFKRKNIYTLVFSPTQISNKNIYLIIWCNTKTCDIVIILTIMQHIKNVEKNSKALNKAHCSYINIQENLTSEY